MGSWSRVSTGCSGRGASAPWAVTEVQGDQRIEPGGAHEILDLRVEEPAPDTGRRAIGDGRNPQLVERVRIAPHAGERGIDLARVLTELRPVRRLPRIEGRPRGLR